MNILEFTLLIWLGSLLAGFLGSLTGLGGGIVVVPLLTLCFGVDIRYAIGASLVSVIATSSGAAAAYVKEGYTNIRIGMFLEIATTLGALAGAMLAAKAPTHVIAVIFGIVLLFSAYLSERPRSLVPSTNPPDPLAVRLTMDGSYPTDEGRRVYHVRSIPTGFGLMFIAGNLSGLLGIGSGAAKVLAMDQAMGIPFKVSTTTSNFMIGVTAAARPPESISTEAILIQDWQCLSCWASCRGLSWELASWYMPRLESCESSSPLSSSCWRLK